MTQITSVNVGQRQQIPRHPRVKATGIYKTAVSGPVRIGKLGLAGDEVIDRRYHGGPDQAVYFYLAEDYEWWSRRLGRELAPGTFGDNLTLAGLEGIDLAVGDRLSGGGLVLEVSAPRTPCNTLAARMDDPGFVRAFRAAERIGAYCRVVGQGEASAGMALSYEPYPGERISILKLFRDWFIRRTLSTGDLRRTLAAPIGVRLRRDWEKLLEARESAGSESQLPY